MSMLLVEKYRPKTFDELVANEDLKLKLEEFINNEFIPNLLLYGPPGTGKTTIAKIIINTIIKDNRDLLLINASDDRGMDMIRNRLVPFLKSKPFKSKIKIIFAEEVGSPSGGLTSAAQSALLNYIEENSTYNRFIFTTNFANELLPSLRSRFTQYYIAPMNKNYIIERVKYICNEEGIEYTEKDIIDIVNTLYPNMRTILQVIEKCTINKNGKKIISKDLLIDSLRDIYLINRTKLAQNIVVALWKSRHALSNNTIQSLPYIINQIADISIDELIKYIDVNYTELDLLELIVDLKKKQNYNPAVIDLINMILEASNLKASN